MIRGTRLRRFGSVADLFRANRRKHKHAADPAQGRSPDAQQTLDFYLGRDRAKKALSLLLANIRKENPGHHDRIVSDLEHGRWSALTDYILHMAFLESIRPPVRPLALPSRVGDWLLALPDNRAGYYPEDMCWECGYAYPFSWTPGSADPGSTPGSAGMPASSSAMHPWVGRHCLYCGGEIVDHLEWLSPNPKRTLYDFHNAPYRKKRESMQSNGAENWGNALP
jgi:hypothetical protein